MILLMCRHVYRKGLLQCWEMKTPCPVPHLADLTVVIHLEPDLARLNTSHLSLS